MGQITPFPRPARVGGDRFTILYGLPYLLMLLILEIDACLREEFIYNQFLEQFSSNDLRSRLTRSVNYAKYFLTLDQLVQCIR